jgi:hypothetical protein
MIHTVSVSATTVASQSASVGAEMVTQNQLVAQSISNTVANDASLSGVDVGSSKANSGSDDWSGWN